MKKTIVFLLPSLEVGGAEKVTLNLINNIDRETFDPEIVLHRRGAGNALRNTLRIECPIKVLKVNKNKWAWLPLTGYIIRKKVKFIISVMDDSSINLLLAKKISRFFGIKCKAVCISHIAISQVQLGILGRCIFRFFVTLLFPDADALIAISKKVREDYITTFPFLKNKVQVIYNAAFDDSLFNHSEQSVDHQFFRSGKPILVNCGRLVPQKGVRYLIEAFAVIGKNMDCRLIIIGDGPERGYLENLSAESGLSEKISFTGLVANPLPYMKKADIYVHSALFDGLPTVLIEALACGCAIVSTDCPAGPSEIIENGKSGLLVQQLGDSKALAEAVLSLLFDPQKIEIFRKNAYTRSMLFHAKTIVPQYEALIKSVLKT